jgi:predicted RNase H-like HicB family nuclease
MFRYVALIDGRAGAYGLVIPDLPGCSSGGRTMDEAVRNAQEAVSLWVGEMAAQGGMVPEPRTIEAAVADVEVAAAIAEGAALAFVPLVGEG